MKWLWIFPFFECLQPIFVEYFIWMAEILCAVCVRQQPNKPEEEKNVLDCLTMPQLIRGKPHERTHTRASMQIYKRIRTSTHTSRRASSNWLVKTIFMIMIMIIFILAIIIYIMGWLFIFILLRNIMWSFPRIWMKLLISVTNFS